MICATDNIRVVASFCATCSTAPSITLVGRRVTVIHNGKTMIADQIIPGITGSVLDSDEAAPGPTMLKGEETVVELRNITISVPAAGPTNSGARRVPTAASL